MCVACRPPQREREKEKESERPRMNGGRCVLHVGHRREREKEKESERPRMNGGRYYCCGLGAIDAVAASPDVCCMSATAERERERKRVRETKDERWKVSRDDHLDLLRQQRRYYCCGLGAIDAVAASPAAIVVIGIALPVQDSRTCAEQTQNHTTAFVHRKHNNPDVFYVTPWLPSRLLNMLNDEIASLIPETCFDSIPMKVRVLHKWNPTFVEDGKFLSTGR
ncbi:hypothetical protein QVD17_31143 [Tagetes erecta]|uniref:Uncharacterized protein n=1 Tax=Tagetes erecta TaxID=13708 RepID=A0AAD8K6Y2_TARER|nr:hypothetical protein QVD17_31143 [Tagetes erecta]